MALKSFGRMQEGTAPVSPSSSSASSPAPAAGGLTAFIDQGSEFEGKLSFRDTVRIDGSFRGEISSENTLIVGETGEIDATIRSKNVVVSGSVEGDICATTKVVLNKTARVSGNIETPSIAVEEGAVLNGQIKMSGGASKGVEPKGVEPKGVEPKASGEKSGQDEKSAPKAN